MAIEAISVEEFNREKRILMRSWKAQQYTVDDIIDLGFCEAININGAYFAKGQQILTCVDGRVRVQRKLGLPGSGIGMTDAEREKVAELIKKAKIEIIGVSRHAGCGAEAAAAHEMKLLRYTPEEIEREIKRRYEHMAALLNVEIMPSAPMTHMHFHNERALILSGVDHINPFGISHFSPFLVNARFMPSTEQTLATVSFCINIAMGQHGFGEDHFIHSVNDCGDKGKFLIVIIGSPYKNDYSCAALREQLVPHIEKYRELVHIVEYEVPKELLK